MKIQYKHQKFQADAAKAVVDVFAGQPYLTPTYMMDRGTDYQYSITDDVDFTGWSNQRIVPELNDQIILTSPLHRYKVYIVFFVLLHIYQFSFWN